MKKRNRLYLKLNKDYKKQWQSFTYKNLLTSESHKGYFKSISTSGKINVRLPKQILKNEKLKVILNPIS